MKNNLNELKTWKNKPFIKQLIKAFPKAEIFLVGGVVRDTLLGKETKDFDLVVRGVSKKDLEKFLQSKGEVNLVGKRFGVFKFRPKGYKGLEIDIALPRTEHSITLSGAYKDFKISSNAKLKIEDDLSRRDFTVNAMAWDIIGQELIDPFNGLKDLKDKKIRAVGDPKKRFAEDYSRLLRAIRFAVKLDFNIEVATFAAVKKEIQKLNKEVDDKRVVPEEIIANELNKALIANPAETLNLLDKSGALAVIMPELLEMKGCPQPKKWHKEGTVWRHTLLALTNVNSKKFLKEFKGKVAPAEVVWGILFHDVGKPYTVKKTDRLRFDNHDGVSARIFRTVSKRLKLSSAGLDTEMIKTIVAKHMLPAHANIPEMKDVTIEKYFYSDKFPGEELLMLIFTDISASIHANGKADFTDYRKIIKRVEKLGGKGKKTLPKPLINGNDLMKTLKVKSGPQMGKLLKLAREAQLQGKIKTKKQGLTYIKKHL